MAISHHRSNAPSVAPIQSFIRSLLRVIDEALEGAALPAATEITLRHTRVHLEWTERVLHDAYRLTRRDAAGSQSVALVTDGELRAAARSVAQNTRVLVPTIKSLSEGTLDRIPSALLDWLVYELSCTDTRPNQAAKGSLTSLPASPDTAHQLGVVLCPVTDLNYFYMNPSRLQSRLERLVTSLERQLGDIAAAVSNRPVTLPLPPIIKFHYAMEQDVLFNALVFHELGHHVYQRERIGEEVGQRLRPMVEVLLSAHNTKYSTLGNEPAKREELLGQRVGWLLSWIQELFCDAFALAVVGPHAFCASKDLFAFWTNPMTFTHSHPADRFRLEQQWKLLKTLGWVSADDSKGGAFRRSTLELWNRMDPGADRAPGDYVFEDAGVMAELPHYIGLLQTFGAEAAIQACSRVDRSQARAGWFWEHGEAVEAAFIEAVVPSTIAVGRTWLGAVKQRTHPHPTTVVNVARLIYDNGCDALINRWIPTQSGDPPFQKVRRLEERLGEWTHKAIADYVLVVRSGVSL